MSINNHIEKAIASKVGHAVIATNDGRRSFAYTIGLTELGFPEVIVFGLPENYAAMFLNQIAALMKATGEIADGTLNDELAHMPTAFKTVTAHQAREFACQAVYRYGCDLNDKLRFLQMVVPDRSGKMPWEDGYDSTYMDQFQPRLWEVKA